MNIGFSATILARGLAGPGIDGIGAYTRALGAALVRAGAGELTPVGFGVDVPSRAIPGAASALRLRPYAPEAVRCALLPGAFDARPLRARGISLFHATDHLVPRFRGLPVVATLMDAIPLSHPEWVRTRFAAQKRWIWRRAAGWADRVLTISEFSKRELVRHFGLPDQRIDVIPLGVDARRFERIPDDGRLRTLARLGLPDRFFLFVGTLQPRKNLERALDAHASLPPRIRDALPFVVVGRTGWGCEALVRRLEAAERTLEGVTNGATGAAGGAATAALTRAGARPRLRWLRYLPDDELEAVMQSATALVFPSLCEGFGLPVLEAFAAGIPVVTSTTTSLPEVAEGAALLVDPGNVGEIADAMAAIVDTPGLALRLVEAGVRRARELSWDACAQATLRSYRRVL